MTIQQQDKEIIKLIRSNLSSDTNIIIRQGKDKISVVAECAKVIGKFPILQTE